MCVTLNYRLITNRRAVKNAIGAARKWNEHNFEWTFCQITKIDAKQHYEDDDYSEHEVDSDDGYEQEFIIETQSSWE